MGHSCINIEGKVQIIYIWYILYLLKYNFFLNLAVHTQMSHIALANIYCIGMYLIPLSSYGSFINNHRKKTANYMFYMYIILGKVSKFAVHAQICHTGI